MEALNNVGPNSVIAVPFAELLSGFSAGFLRTTPGGAQGAHAGSMSAGRFAKAREMLKETVPIR
jgi:hypothetical protein